MAAADTDRIRNFCIIAHIDHGKSTLADRMLELTGALTPREMTDQVLDSMALERERGITIKAHPVRLHYRAGEGREYILNLIDTPGHVDFSYEVSRSLAACEGAVLVVDAAQGVEAQTVANAYLALEHDLALILAINKIDLPSADPEGTKRQIEEVIGLDAADAVLISAKEGKGVREVLEAVVRTVPPPRGRKDHPLQAMIFDSWFDAYQGAVCALRVYEGEVCTGQRVRLMSSGATHEVQKVGVLTPRPVGVDRLAAGEVGFIIAGIKDVRELRIGDTLTDARRPAAEALPGFRVVKPVVFSGLYPTDPGQYGLLRDALGKLRLNDSSFSFEPETSQALGFGFRCGFLGLLHMEIIQERLEREYGLSLITTAPTVLYLATTTDGEVVRVENPMNLPPPQRLRRIEEPFIRASVLVPADYLGPILGLCQERRGTQVELRYLSTQRVLVVYDLPLNEVIVEFYDRLKSLSRGYASFDYDPIEYREANLVRLDVLINGEIVDSLSTIVYRDRAYERGKAVVTTLRGLIPRQLFDVVIQAAIGSKVIAREVVKPLRKHVTAKCYGGDVTRKRKLLERQKEGKKRMKQVGRVEIPQEAFLAVLKAST